MILAAFLLDFAVACGLVATPFLAFALLKAGPGLTGTLGAMQMALYAVGCLLSAYFLRGAQFSLWWAIGGVSVFALLYALLPTTNTPLLFVHVATVPFLGLALAWPAMQAWVGSERNPTLRAKYLSWFNTATAFGFTVSPLIIGPLFDYDMRAPFAGLVVIGGIAVMLLISLPRNLATEDLRSDPNDEHTSKQPIHLELGLLYASWFATSVANGLVTSVRAIYPKRIESLVESRELTLIASYRPAWLDAVGAATSFSWLAFLLSFSTVICFLILGRTKAWQHRFAWIVWGQISAAGALLLLATAKSIGLLLFCFAIQGASFGISFFASLYYSLFVPEKSHRRAAINEGALGAGGFFGGVGVGYLAEHVGVERAFLLAPVPVLMALLVQIWMLKRFRSIDG